MPPGPSLYFAEWVLSVAGDLDTGRRAGATGLDRLADVDPMGLRVLAGGASALAHAQAGELDAAAAQIDQVNDDPGSARPGRPSPAPGLAGDRGLGPPLSSRELEIAERAAAGRPSKEIADELFLLPRTVDNHLGPVYSKLGLAGRAELADWFSVTHSVVNGCSIPI